MTLSPLPLEGRRSPFAGQQVHRLLGLEMSPGAHLPVFEDEVWDLRGVKGAPMQFARHHLVLDFTGIPRTPWKMVAREFLAALSAPHNEHVASLPWARREPMALASCVNKHWQVEHWFRWLDQHGIDRLSEVTQEHCDRWLLEQKNSGRKGESSLTSDVITIKDPGRYSELFSTDSYRPGFMPWSTTPASVVVGYKNPGENLTPPVPDSVMQPALRAGLFLVESIGPHVLTLAGELSKRRALALTPRRPSREEIAELLNRYVEAKQPLPELDPHWVSRRLKEGWATDDPLLPVSFGQLCRDLGVSQIYTCNLSQLRGLFEDALSEVGVAPYWARDAALIDLADGSGSIPWSGPLTASRVDDLAAVVFNSALFVAAAVSGLRASELMELTAASCLPPEEVKPGLFRYRLASKRIKGEEWGGVPDEWIIIEPGFRAVDLAAKLVGTSPNLSGFTSSGPDESVFGRYSFAAAPIQQLRSWVNSPAGQRLGLEPIPGSTTGWSAGSFLWNSPNDLTASGLRKCTSSTYRSPPPRASARPGGAQAHFHGELAEEERKHKAQLTAEAYRQYREGRLPAGPGASGLVAAFQHVDDQLAAFERKQPTVVATDRQIELLLKKRAQILHIQPANYCWADPSKALCLKLAGTPDADKPLAGLCDAARCPQATFHPEHRDVWAGAADSTATFLGNPRVRKGEKLRLTAEHDRARRVIDAIDTACTGDDQA
jgi:hypothetical protein